MICLKCHCEEFVRVDQARIEQEIRDEIVAFWGPALACKRCGAMTLDDRCANELIKQFWEYRKRNWRHR